MELDRPFTERCQIVVGRPDLNDDIGIIGVGNFPDIEIDKLPTNRKGGEPGWRGKGEGAARLRASAKVVANRKARQLGFLVSREPRKGSGQRCGIHAIGANHV